MALRQSLRLRQRPALTPELRRSLALLSLPLPELVEAIDREVEENPFLLCRKPASSAYDVALATVEAPVSLVESLQRQLSVMKLDHAVREVAFYLSGDLTDDGYLPASAAESALEIGVPQALVEEATRALQGCEPRGVGARSLAECLSLQLRDAGMSEEEAALITGNLDHFAKADWRALKRATGLPRERLEEMARLLRTLTPYPAERFGEPAAPVQPDIAVEPDQLGGHRAVPIGDAMPELSLDSDLLERALADAEARSYARDCRVRAESLFRAVVFRGRTLLRVTSEIVRVQHRFFAGETDHLEPLTRSGIAGQLALSPSTVTRAMAGKYLQAGGAVYPLRFFVSPAVRAGKGGALSAYSVQQKIRQLVEQESPDAILSDDAIVRRLRADGVDIARRTVAKYRGCMNIPSSFERRQLKATRRAHPERPGGVKSVKR